MAYNNQGPLFQNMSLLQKEQLLSDQQTYNYTPNTPYANNPQQNYPIENR